MFVYLVSISIILAQPYYISLYLYVCMYLIKLASSDCSRKSLSAACCICGPLEDKNPDLVFSFPLSVKFGLS